MEHDERNGMNPMAVVKVVNKLIKRKRMPVQVTVGFAYKFLVFLGDNIIQKSINSNPILVTALNRIIGYEKGAYIAKKAYKLGIPIIDVALEETNLSEKDLKKILDPLALTKGGIK